MSAVKAYIAAHLASRQVSRVIYGAIIGLALVVALEHDPPPVGAVIATLVGTAIAVGLAELYSDLVAFELRRHEHVTKTERRHVRGEVAAVVFGIAFPAVFFLLAAADVFEEKTAFRVAKWAGLGLIGIYGFAGARASGSNLARSLLQAAGVALIGGLLIALKALVH